ncbi:MAG: hypothetical protein IJ328_01055 [Muribaculaceae bacterium]|nr:hypothetical protein [Muribaculaceae bacterium]
MDKTKKMISKVLAVIVMLLGATGILQAQKVEKIEFCDKHYEYKPGKDSITLFFNLLDSTGNHVKISGNDIKLGDNFDIKEDGEYINPENSKITVLSSGQRISAEYTFSVLVDLTIPQSGKDDIYKTIRKLVDSAPDSCVYLSFFGDEVSESRVVTKANYKEFKNNFEKKAENKYFYSGLYAKLLEFGKSEVFEDSVRAETGYKKNTKIADRAESNKEKNILFVFTEGGNDPTEEDLSFIEVTGFQGDLSHIAPKVVALYYTEENEEPNIKKTLEGICKPRNITGDIIKEREGKYLPANEMEDILKNFEEVVNDAMYDYAFTYKVVGSKNYSGKVGYEAEWKNNIIGSGEFSVGTAERSWPIRVEDTGDIALKYLYALLITLGTIAFFFIVTKILVPYIRFKSFSLKYYKRYVPEANVSRRICHYCKQDIQPGQYVVMKCKHIMHVFCWQQNGYKCAEYGQNCKTGIQSHIEWSGLFSLNSIKDCGQSISGIIAGFISWICYEIFGGGLLDVISTHIVELFYSSKIENGTLFTDCVTKTSAFLIIGILLGFFLSLIFRSNDEYKKKDFKVWCKILGLSILTGVIGMIAFALGANIMCLLLSATEMTYIPWYCSLPAYILFSISVSLALTIKSTIPVKSALLGGLCSALIGFIVLYCSSYAGNTSGRMNMLLDFIIYGGGLGASLVTVRMLAEKYFLVIQNGVRAGQKIPIHKWMNATGGGNKVTIGMTGECEIQMNWEKSNKVAKEHAQLFIDYDKQLPMLKPLAAGVVFNTRAELPVGKPSVLSNGDNFKIGDTIFLYQETE